MASNDITLLIFQFCLGRFEGPSEFAVFAALAGIDLRSRGVRGQNGFFAGDRLNCIRNFGSRYLLRTGRPEADASSQDDEAHEQRPGSCKCMHRVIVAGQEKRSTISASCDCVVPLRSALLYNLPE